MSQKCSDTLLGKVIGYIIRIKKGIANNDWKCQGKVVVDQKGHGSDLLDIMSTNGLRV